MKRIILIGLWVLSIGATAVIASLATGYAVTAPTYRVVYTWQQPTTLTYDAFGPYSLTVAEDAPDWRGFPFNLGRRHIIFIGRGSTPSYGYFLDYSFHNYAPLKEYLQEQVQVDWSTEGVALREPAGQMVFVPKDLFVGGR